MKKIIIIALGILVSSISYANDAGCTLVKNYQPIMKGICSERDNIDGYDDNTTYVYTSKKIGTNTVVEKFDNHGHASYTLNNKPAKNTYSRKTGWNCYKTKTETFCHGVFYDTEQGE